MKGLLKILLGGFVGFMLLAIVDEWDFFSQAWFGDEEAVVEVPEEERKAAADVLHLCLTLVGHLYQSGGDERFAERMPAAEWVIAEMRADIDYLSRSGLLQDPELLRLDVTAVDILEGDRLELATRELWRIRLRSIENGSDVEPEQVLEARGRYLLVKGSSGWRVDGWNPVELESARETAG